jgi:hypothetical protein
VFSAAKKTFLQESSNETCMFAQSIYQRRLSMKRITLSLVVVCLMLSVLLTLGPASVALAGVPQNTDVPDRPTGTQHVTGATASDQPAQPPSVANPAAPDSPPAGHLMPRAAQAVVSAPIGYGYTGSVQHFTVPCGVTQIDIDAYGGQGGGS